MNDPATEDRPDDKHSNGKSRFDREIDEILSRSGKDLGQDPVPRPKLRPIASGRATPADASLPAWASAWGPRLASSPVLLALVAGIAAVMIAGSSQLLANVFAFAAVVLVLVPVIQRFRSPASRPETKMWRGQVIDPRANLSSPLADVRRWWSSLRR